jgi:hypothetical protein
LSSVIYRILRLAQPNLTHILDKSRIEYMLLQIKLDYVTLG